MITKPVIAGIGELLWDVLPSGKQLGGAPCNFAFHALQVGCESHVISAIGKDELGAEIQNTLQTLGLSDHFVQVNEFSTSTVTVNLNENGHPNYTIHENVAWDHILWNSDLENLSKKLDAVCFGSLAQRNPESKHTIQTFISALKSDCLKVFDINLRQNFYNKEAIIHSINLADILKLNEDELPVVSEYISISGDTESQLLQLLTRFKLKYVIYTMGGNGSIIKSIDESSFIDVPHILVSDTVGAGDAFTAVFISGILLGISLRETHQKATEFAAYVCTQKGATPKLTRDIF